MEGTSVLSGITGGLCLFLVGLWLATDGLKVAAGGVLKANLREWTANRWRSFETGFAISILLPSWGGLTRAAIGLVNSERVSLRHALWVVIGTGFGAVMTAWVVVGIGFSPFLLPLALGILGLGAILRWSGPVARRGAWGQVLVGTGVLFLGLRMLSTTAAALDQRLDTFAVDPLGRILACALAGTVLAAAMTSTSAVVTLVIVATAAGAIDLTSAAALLVGANFGAIASSVRTLLTGTPDARRVATGHVLFHALGSAFGLVLLLCTLPTLRAGGDPRGNTLLLLAGFQTLFCGVSAVFLRLTDARLLQFLQRHFHVRGDEAGRPRHLDVTAITVPVLALEGVVTEVHRIGTVTLNLAQTMFTGPPPSEFRTREDVETVLALAEEVDEYTLRLYHAPLPRRVADVLLDTTRAVHAYRTIAERLPEVRERLAATQGLLHGGLLTRVRQYQHPLLHLLHACHPRRAEWDMPACRDDLQGVRNHLHAVQRQLLAQRSSEIAAPHVRESILERLELLRQIDRLAVDAAEILARVEASVEGRREFAPAERGATALLAAG